MFADDISLLGLNAVGAVMTVAPLKRGSDDRDGDDTRIILDMPETTGLTVKGLNRRGQPVKYKVNGWLARIFQHEIDHLDGIVYTDRATRVWKPREGEEAPVD